MAVMASGYIHKRVERGIRQMQEKNPDKNIMLSFKIS